MKTLTLPSGHNVLLDDQDYERVATQKWYACDRVVLYAMSPSVGYMHRFILSAPNGIKVDHRDGNGLNNQRHNLRTATNQQNVWNSQKMRRQCTSQFKGVCLTKSGKWAAQIKTDKKRNLGTFATETAAAIAYDLAALTNFGEFARTNILKAA